MSFTSPGRKTAVVETAVVETAVVETVRQFLAAFAESDLNGLHRLLAVDVSARIQRQQTVQIWRAQTAVIEALLIERERWAQRRIDVQSWQLTPPAVAVCFVVQLHQEQPGLFQRYEARLAIRAGQVRLLDLSTDVLATPLPAWERVERPGPQIYG